MGGNQSTPLAPPIFAVHLRLFLAKRKLEMFLLQAFKHWQGISFHRMLHH